MKKSFVLVPSLLAFVALAGCADEDTATTDTEHGGSTVDARADSTTSSEAATDNEASSQEDASTSADGSQIDGAQGDHVLLAPPFIVDAPTLDTVVDRLAAAVDTAVATK